MSDTSITVIYHGTFCMSLTTVRSKSKQFKSLNEQEAKGSKQDSQNRPKSS